MKKIIFVSIITLLLIAAGILNVAAEWDGVDVTVIEKFAQDHGRKAWTPFINTDQGDLLLFVFLLAGIGGGFILGFNWRTLFTHKKRLIDDKPFDK